MEDLMQIDKRYKIEKVVSKDPTRENLQNIHVTKRHAFATDGRILAAVPIMAEKGDTEGWMTPDVLKIGRKCSKSDSVSIELNGTQILADGTILVRPMEHRFPTITHILMSAHRNRQLRVGLNVRYLKDLADAIGADEVVLELGKPDEAILVRPASKSNSALGLIMPIRIQ
jgi:hypothetical protein